MATEKIGKATESPVTVENAAVNTKTPTGQKNPAEGTQVATGDKSMTDGKELYTAADFVAAAERLFPDKKSRPSKYSIVAAFRFNGVEQATKEQGIHMIKAFMERTVE